MNMARREFFSKLITENSADQGRLFRATKKLLCETNELFSPDYHDRVALANDIGRFFVRKFERIRCDIEALPDDLMLVNSTQLFSDFQPLKKEDVQADSFRNQTRSLARLTRCRHPLVVKCLDVLLPVITRIINLSLASGQFSDEWKEALVSPSLKSAGLSAEFCNLRPVSNIQFVSKLTERAVFDQTHKHTGKHMTKFGLYALLQSAYRQGFSTEAALQNDILRNMVKKHVTLLKILTERLSCFGMTSTVLSGSCPI